MDIQIAQTGSTVNVHKDGRFWAKIAAGKRLITYVSPYAPKEGGGFFGIPGPKTDIMVIKPSGKDEWYYIGSIVGAMTPGVVPKGKDLRTDPQALASGKVSEESEIVTDRKATAPLDRIYAFRERPMQSVWASPKGHKIQLSDQYNPEQQNTFIGLRSSLGKKIILDDSKDKDHIKIANEHGDFIRLSTNAMPPAQQSNSFTVNTRGNHLYQSRAGNIKLAVAGSGGNINIVNNATGDIAGLVNGMVGLDNSTWGKINILANRNDINLTCGPSLLTSMMGNPSIYLMTQGVNSVIDLLSVGTVNITSVQGISLNSLGPIDINSLSTITMNAPLINLNPLV